MTQATEFPGLEKYLIEYQESGYTGSFVDYMNNRDNIAGTSSSETKKPIKLSDYIYTPPAPPEGENPMIQVQQSNNAPANVLDSFEPGAVQSHPEPKKIPAYRPPKTSDNMYVKMREDMKKRQKRPPQPRPMQQSRPLQRMKSSRQSNVRNMARDAVLQKRNQQQQKIDSAQAKTDSIQAAISKLRSNR